MSPTRRSFVKAAVASFAAASFVWPDPVAAVPVESGRNMATVGILSATYTDRFSEEKAATYLLEVNAADRATIRQYAVWCIRVLDCLPKAV